MTFLRKFQRIQDEKTGFYAQLVDYNIFGKELEQYVWIFAIYILKKYNSGRESTHCNLILKDDVNKTCVLSIQDHEVAEKMKNRATEFKVLNILFSRLLNLVSFNLKCFHFIHFSTGKIFLLHIRNRNEIVRSNKRP